MKRIATVLMLVMLAVFASCEKETLLTVDQTSLSYTDSGGSQTITLTANKPWTASSNPSWCKVSPSAGEEAASSKISISCDANTTYDARTCTVTVSCAELTKTVSISQATNNGLLVSQTSYELTKAAQQLNIPVQANVKFSVEVDNGCKDWISYNTTKSLATSTVVLDISENKKYDSREGKVTIKENGGSLSSTVTIKQSQLDGLFITTPEYNLSNEQHTLTVEVSTNVEFEVKPEADWVKYVQTKGLNSKQIILDVSKNDTYDQRETKVNVKQKNGDLSGVIIIRQDEKYGILVTPSEYDLTNEAQMINVDVKFNVDFDVVIPDECREWISLLSTKGLRSRTYTFSIAKNETYDNRVGSITFKQNDGDLTGTVKIIQAQTDYLIILPQEDSIIYSGGSVDLSIITNVEYDISIENTYSWVSIGEGINTGTKDGLTTFVHPITVPENEEIVARYASIQVKGTSADIITSYVLSQGPQPVVVFQDKIVEKVCLSKFDRNNDGAVSLLEAKSVTAIEPYFFSEYSSVITSFNELNLFVNLSEISPSAFDGCYNLKSIVLPPGLKLIQNGAFNECESLREITIPDGCILDGWMIFRYCHNLESICFPADLKVLPGFLFADCTALTTIELPNSITTIEIAAFFSCKSLSHVSIPESVIKIGEAAFESSGIEEIEFPSSIIAIEKEMCWNCTKLKKIVIPSSILTIHSTSFSYCPSIQEVQCYTTEPPIMSSNAFQDSPNAKLYVPKGCIDAYSEWGAYFGGGIYEIE